MWVPLILNLGKYKKSTQQEEVYFPEREIIFFRQKIC